ncbi:MAG: hypothetical protein LBH44_01970 [Treponema sp.]|nr:hypothetical protein [Treponema sp.]
MKKFLVIAGILLLLIISCDDSGGAPEKKFWAIDFRTDTSYSLDAELLSEGRHCKVWVEKGSGVNEAEAWKVANIYDTDIYPKMMKTFSFAMNLFYEGKIVAKDAMELADFYGDGDGKLCILLLKIRDGYQKGKNDAYIGGYFNPVDFFEYDPAYPKNKTNECDMVYVGVHPVKPGTTASNATIAHEVQHLMNFVTSLVTRFDGKDLFLMDTWVNEGLSCAAEWVYSGEHPEGRWKWFNNDPSGLIAKGNNFYLWGNRHEENKNAVLDDYATVYLFFQWLRLQSGSNAIYKEIITSEDFNFKAVTKAFDKAVPGQSYSDWGTLLKTWLAANYINAPSGSYGYKNDPTLKKLKITYAPEGTKNLQLAPGEGVYSLTTTASTTPSPMNNIKYAGLSTGNPVSDTNVYTGGALLTYNVNTEKTRKNDGSEDGSKESGTTTGLVPPSANMVSGGRALLGDVPLSGPFPIGAGDMMRNRHVLKGFKMSKIGKVVTIYE